MNHTTPNALTSDIVKISESTIGGQEIPTVSARDLHAGLGVGKDFSTWVKSQIKRARLFEGRDFITVAQKGVGGKFDSIEYHLTIDAAKHISMLSNTEKGFEIREYFITCEKRLAVVTNSLEALIKEKLTLARLFEVPMHMAQVELVKQVREETGRDLSPWLKLSSAQVGLSPEDEMLEPTQIGKHFGIGPQKVNKMLAEAGLQL